MKDPMKLFYLDNNYSYTGQVCFNSLSQCYIYTYLPRITPDAENTFYNKIVFGALEFAD